MARTSHVLKTCLGGKGTDEVVTFREHSDLREKAKQGVYTIARVSFVGHSRDGVIEVDHILWIPTVRHGELSLYLCLSLSLSLTSPWHFSTL